jgi:2,4-dienoyl-CoA reductase-like NADH-dependent reductase (Old Yellow Enzyme family)
MGFPLHKSRKRYEDGPGDDFVAYYSAIAEGEADGW